MIEREHEQPPWRHHRSRRSQGIAHRPGMMQHAPGIDHVEYAEPAHILAVEDRALLDRPIGIARKMSDAQAGGAEDGRGVEVERMDPRAEPAGGEREQTAAGADIDEAQPGEGVALEQIAYGFFRFGDLIGAQITRKVEPVVAKAKAALFNRSVQHSLNDASSLSPIGPQLYDFARPLANAQRPSAQASSAESFAIGAERSESSAFRRVLSDLHSNAEIRNTATNTSCG